MRGRPAVSVIVPFSGSEAALQQLRAGLGHLYLGPQDEVILADNRPGATSGEARERLRTVAANGLRSPGFARNCAAQSATGEWLVFIDADTIPDPSLLQRYFEPVPAESTGVLAGAIRDLAAMPTLTARHGVHRAQMSQDVTLRRSGSPYAQTANCAVRRHAFSEVGGFTAEARAGEDADLCFRLASAGWALEERPGATVQHRSRERLPALLSQLARHGSGAAWCNRRHPGSFPAPTPRELGGRLRVGAADAVKALGRGDLEGAAFAGLDLLEGAAFELGRLLPNRARH